MIICDANEAVKERKFELSLNWSYLEGVVYSLKDPSPELVLVMKRKLTTWGFNEKPCSNLGSYEIADVKRSTEVCCQFWILLWHLNTSSQDIKKTFGEMKK